MAKKGARKTPSGTGTSAKPPDQPSPQDQKELRDAVVDQAEPRAENLRKRPDEVRLDMMRSIITEPLLSQVQQKAKAGEMSAKFDVILAINEFFVSGPQRAVEFIEMRAKEWDVKYAKVSHYVFARLSVERILILADEARELFDKNGKGGSVIYRIWEDTEIDVTLNKSLPTIKADGAQRSFQAYGQARCCSPQAPCRTGECAGAESASFASSDDRCRV